MLPCKGGGRRRDSGSPAKRSGKSTAIRCALAHALRPPGPDPLAVEIARLRYPAALPPPRLRRVRPRRPQPLRLGRSTTRPASPASLPAASSPSASPASPATRPSSKPSSSRIRKPAGGGVVARAVDGDPIIAAIEGGEETVRLIGIGAPERAPDECYGRKAFAFAADRLPPGALCVEAFEAPISQPIQEQEQ